MVYVYRVMRQQWLKREELIRLQEKMLRSLIHHVYKNIPYYRRTFKDLGIFPEDIKTVQDLTKLPILDRDLLLKEYRSFVVANHGYHYLRQTSGSSGKPRLRIYFDERAWDYLEAIYARSWFNIGYKPWERIAYYWYKPFERKIYNFFGLMRKDFIDASLDETEQIQLLSKLQPKVISYFPSILYSLCKKMKKEGIEINPRIVQTQGEVISKSMRKTIENILNCKVYDRYGTAEFNIMASECLERIGYHIDVDSVIIEVIKDGEPVSEGEWGEAVVTGLVNYFQPLIRYNLKDIISYTEEKCPCGRGLPLLHCIEGRKEDLIKTKGGKIFTPKQIIDVIASLPQIYKFRVVYRGRNRFRVNIVPLDDREDEKFLEEKIRKSLEESLGERINVGVKFVDDIPKSWGGKRSMMKVV